MDHPKQLPHVFAENMRLLIFTFPLRLVGEIVSYGFWMDFSHN